jgi:hypothetical protein
VFHLKRNSLTTTHEPLHAENGETNDNIEFLQQYSVAAVDELLEIGTAVISAVLSFDETFHRQTLPVSRNFVTSRCTVVLFGTSLSGYALLNVLRTPANDLDAK